MRSITDIYRAWEQELHDNLHKLREERSPPVNYKSLSISNTHFTYVEVLGRPRVVLFADITRVEFVREEAMFPCLNGPYLETKWIVLTAAGSRLVVMDEPPHRRKLLAAFCRHLRGFMADAASVGFQSGSAGTWLCYSAAQS